MRASQTEIAKRIAEAMETRRKELHLTRAAIAQRSGLSASTITRLGQGRFAPTPDSLRAIAGAIEMPWEELFNLAGWPQPNRPQRGESHLQVIYYNIPTDVAEEIEFAIEEIAARHDPDFVCEYTIAHPSR